jgi:hypothetical protein
VLALWEEFWPELSWGRCSYLEIATIPDPKNPYGFESSHSSPR